MDVMGFRLRKSMVFAAIAGIFLVLGIWLVSITVPGGYNGLFVTPDSHPHAQAGFYMIMIGFVAGALDLYFYKKGE